MKNDSLHTSDLVVLQKIRPSQVFVQYFRLTWAVQLLLIAQYPHKDHIFVNTNNKNVLKYTSMSKGCHVFY